MRSEIKRMVSGRGFWAAVLLGMTAVLAGTEWPDTKELLPAGQFLAISQKALCSKPVCYLLPAAAVLPWSDSFLGEWRGGYLKSLLPRTGRGVYAENKMMSVAFSGFLVWAAVGSFALFLDFVVFFPMEEKGSIHPEAAWELAGTLLRCGMISAILASLGGICGVLGGSGYLAFGFPFVGYYFCIILQERYFPDALWLYPPQWISGAAQWGANGEGLWLFLALTLGLTAGAHGAVVYGRIEEI